MLANTNTQTSFNPILQFSHHSDGRHHFLVTDSTDNKGDPCGRSRCVICPKMNFKSVVRSSTTHNYFLTRKPPNLNCSTKNVVYLITCTACNVQYVGQTSQTIKNRMSAHRHSFDHDILNTFLSKHFKRTGHNRESFSIDILDYGNDNKDLLLRENQWIRALNTAFPLGLNDQISRFGNISDRVNPLNKPTHPYFSLPPEGVPKKHRSRNQRKRTIRPSQCDRTIDGMINTVSELNPLNIFTFIRNTSKVYIKRLLEYTSSPNFQSLTFELRYKIFSIVCGHFWEKKEHKNKLEEPTTFLKCKYFGKCIERLRLERELNRKQVRDSLSILIPKGVPRISIIYSLTPPTSSFLCNYGSFLKNLTRRKADEILNSDCSCCLFPSFIDPHHGHICTGDTNFINDNTLRTLFQKGSKYRPPISFNFQDIENELHHNINDMIARIGRRGKSTAILSQQVAQEVTSFLLPRLMRRLRTHDASTNPDIKQSLRQLHDSFVVTIVDKASGNYAFTCKKQYLLFMEKEMNTTTSNLRTYEPVTESNIDSIIDKHNSNARSFGLKLRDNSTLPRIYAIPKMHKTPIKARFITGAHNSSLKPISIDLQRILKHMREHFRRYCTLIKERTGVNHFFSIDNSEQVVSKLRTSRSGYTTLFCADFTSLFTNLPHSTVLENLYSLIDLLFDHCKMNYISMSNGRAKYSKTNGGPRSYHRGDVKLILKYILENSYATYAGTLYKQNRGIPQGNNASPQIADLTLAFMEFKYVKNHINHSHIMAHSLSRTFRYIDDLLHCSTQSNLFCEMTNDMYHQSLTLERTNETDNKANFLDLDITCVGVDVYTKLYNKTDDYSFKVIRYPQFSSNIPMRIGLNTLHGEIIRIFRTCTYLPDFIARNQLLLHTFETNGYPLVLLYTKFIKTLNKNPSIALKYSSNNHFLCTTVTTTKY